MDINDNREIGQLVHSCWTYWGHSGAPIIHRGKLIGLHSSWDDETGTRHGVHLLAILEFLNSTAEFVESRSFIAPSEDKNTFDIDVVKTKVEPKINLLSTRNTTSSLVAASSHDIVALTEAAFHHKGKSRRGSDDYNCNISVEQRDENKTEEEDGISSSRSTRHSRRIASDRVYLRRSKAVVIDLTSDN